MLIPWYSDMQHCIERLPWYVSKKTGLIIVLCPKIMVIYPVTFMLV